MMDAVEGMFVTLSAVGTCEIKASLLISSLYLPLLRITLKDMLPWIMIWIAIAGIARLFARGGSSDHETSTRQDSAWESDADGDS